MLIVAVIEKHCYIETSAYNLLSMLLTCVAAQSTDACVSTVCLQSMWWFLPANIPSLHQREGLLEGT